MSPNASLYTVKDHQKLRFGYTTGSCATAATKAALLMLLTGQTLEEISIHTPKGIDLTLTVSDISMDTNQVSCAITKDAGDDADVTHGTKVFSTVSYSSGPDVSIDGGIGVGRITKPGLEQPVGAAAINRVPRQMITQVVTEECNRLGYDGGISVIISVPDGERLAAQTFNPRLGIEGGISILGTSGIVEPMSEQALIDTIKVEMKQKYVTQDTPLLLAPGNYGQQYILKEFSINLEQSVKCSNFIGEAFDYAYDLGYQQIILIGHIGKLVKVGAGIMNTHSKTADARMETLCSCVVLAGGDTFLAKNILSCNTTDDALSVLAQTPYFRKTMDILLEKIIYHLRHRTRQEIQIEVILFSNVYGILAQSEKVDELISILKNSNKT